MKFAITLLVLLLSHAAFSQTLFTAPVVADTCGKADLTEEELAALPWYGYEDGTFLDSFYDRLKNTIFIV